jgi:hypothetical protein
VRFAASGDDDDDDDEQQAGAAGAAADGAEGGISLGAEAYGAGSGAAAPVRLAYRDDDEE